MFATKLFLFDLFLGCVVEAMKQKIRKGAKGGTGSLFPGQSGGGLGRRCAVRRHLKHDLNHIVLLVFLHRYL